jgi:NADH-quinone oxidoreductase subunit L
MTIPLIILGTMAIVAGFFGAEALHIAPLTHRLEAGFEGISQVVHRPGVGEGQVWVMMVPGVLAFVVGSGAAYMVYAQGGGKAERNFQASFPRLYGLIYDKWRIDELYDATVIGMVDALADIFVMADQWFVDGILAKLSALIVSSVGSLLRLFQTGRVQVYAASMAVGVLGVGWFMTTPHAAYSIDQANLSTTGEVLVKPAPGLGYQYKWSGDGVKQNDFSALTDYSFVVEPGKTRKVTLAVKNAFGRESDETITISRPVPKPGEGAPMFFPQQHAAAPEQAPVDKGIIKVEGSQIGDLVKGGGQ